jgi:streptogramin lyase
VRRLLLVALVSLLPGAADARPLKGAGPSVIATGYGAVWIGFGNGTVMRVDERTLQVRYHMLDPTRRAYILSIATGLGSVWVAPSGLPIHRLDPRTGAVRATIRNQPGVWSGAPAQVAVGAGYAWLANHERNAVLRVNVPTNRIGRRAAVTGRLRSIAAGKQAVWVQTVPKEGPVTGPEGTRFVSRLDPRTMRFRRAFRTSCDVSLLPSGGSVWVLDGCAGALSRFDARSRRLSQPLVVAGAGALSAGFGSIWISGGRAVRRFRHGRVAAQVRVPGIVAAGERYVWVLDPGNGVTGWLRRIDPSRNRVVGPPITLSSRAPAGG